MQNFMRLMRYTGGSILAALVAASLAGCASPNDSSSKPAAATPASPAMAAAPAAAAKPAIRIDAAATAPYTDSSGNVWLADTGFKDGETVDRGNDTAIANTKDPAIYRTERYGMTAFTYNVPNGKYTVNLHFAETYDDISAAGGRVFTVNVCGHDIKDLDVFARAGGAKKAYIESVPVEVTNGKVDITFTANVQSPEINGIEIIPAP